MTVPHPLERSRRGRRELAGFLLASSGNDLAAAPEAVAVAAAAVPPTCWHELPALAARHGVVLSVHAAAGELGSVVPARVRAELRVEALAQVAHQLRIARSLDALTGLLGPASIDWLVLKGPVLADHVYRVPGRRGYADLDVLVRPDRLRGALELLEGGGATLLTRNWEWVVAEGKSELQLRLPTGIDLDLHWNVIGSPAKADGVGFDTAELMVRARRLPLGAAPGPVIDVATLGETDQLLHLAVHAVRDGLRSLRLLVDVDQAWRHERPPIQELLTRARQTGSGLFLAVALQAAGQAVGTPVEPDVLAELAGPGSGSWLAAMRRLDRYQLRSSMFRDPWFGGVRATTRTDSRTSVAAAAAHGRRTATTLMTSSAKLRQVTARLRGRTPSFATELALQARDVDGGIRERFLRSLEAG